MAVFHEYDQYDGLGLAELVREKAVTPAELAAAALDRIEKYDTVINAIVCYPDPATLKRNLAGVPSGGVFAGVPFLLKDAHHAFKGVPMRCGSAAMQHHVPDRDAEIVKRFKRAGLVLVGKASTPEFKLSAVTEPAVSAPTRNPWNPAYACGGSSGGSAAAVAARMVPIASGTDEGGSIRIPAAYCGVFGLKPSRGRNPVGPDFNEALCGLSTSHVITRSVRDSAAILDAVAGPEPGGPYAIPDPETGFLQAIKTDPPPLRIALYLPTAFGRESHPDCVAAVNHAAQLLMDLGHVVEPADPGYDYEFVVMTWCRIVAGHFGAYLDALIEKDIITDICRNLELQNRTLYTFGKRMRAADLVQALHDARQLGLGTARFMTQYDYILTPTLGKPPVRIGSVKSTLQDRLGMHVINSFLGKLLSANRRINDALIMELARNAVKKQMLFTMIANLTGQPAMSVPLHWNAEGLPCGVQFIGRHGDEAGLLRLAAQLEKASPWLDKKPLD